jgi:diaminopimelate epimerase
MRRWSFTKGHGTGNDFVLILDRESMLEISPDDVRMICDRHLGVGADGLLRAVLARHVPGWTGDGSVWFMDYRNADGSVAEMCGNGARVFVRYLLENDLASGPNVPVATRSGLREAVVLPDGRIRVAMGPVAVGDSPVVVRTGTGEEFKAVTADVGNPHAVSFTDDLAHLPLHAPPSWEPVEQFPAGVNLEFVRILGDRHIAMRVYERGSGETQSCGTGTVAAAAAARARTSDPATLPLTYRVDVPGGTVEVELTEEQSYLTGPAVLVAHGELYLPDAVRHPDPVEA